MCAHVHVCVCAQTKTQMMTGQRMPNATREVLTKGFVPSKERVHIPSWRTQKKGTQQEVDRQGWSDQDLANLEREVSRQVKREEGKVRA